VIIDELGRGTSPKEGFAIALAMCEKFIKTEARVFFSTHFTKIGEIPFPFLLWILTNTSLPGHLLNAASTSGVINIHLASERTTSGRTSQLTLPHKVASGPVPSEDYGLDLARRFLPSHVLTNATRIAQYIRSHDAVTLNTDGPLTVSHRVNRLNMGVAESLRNAVDSAMEDAVLARYADAIRARYAAQMQAVLADDAAADGAPARTERAGLRRPNLTKPRGSELRAMRRRFREEERRILGRDRDGGMSRGSTVPSSQTEPFRRGEMIRERLERRARVEKSGERRQRKEGSSRASGSWEGFGDSHQSPIPSWASGVQNLEGLGEDRGSETEIMSGM